MNYLVLIKGADEYAKVNDYAGTSYLCFVTWIETSPILQVYQIFFVVSIQNKKFRLV